MKELGPVGGSVCPLRPPRSANGNYLSIYDGDNESFPTLRKYCWDGIYG